MATQKQKEKALERATKAQTRYWDALRALEQALGFDIEADELGELDGWSVVELEDRNRRGDDGDDDNGGDDDNTCGGGCGRPAGECASGSGAGYCADVDDWRKHGRPATWEAFEKLHFADEDAQAALCEHGASEHDSEPCEACAAEVDCAAPEAAGR